MRKLRTVLCLLILALTIPTAYELKRSLPTDTQPLIEAKYGGWSGVLRLWVRESWPVGSGSAAAWINRCISTFEKRHPGVYIQPEYIEASALTAEGILPPDLILFPPGEVDADRLAALDFVPPVRAGLPRDDRAAPVLLGGYLWAYNARMIESLPNTWRGTGQTVAAPPDEASRQWSAALLALCSAKYSEEGPGNPSAPQSEIELGLSGGDAAETPTPAPAEGTLSCLLPEDFEPDGAAWRTFTNGEAAAMPVTQREIRRLEALSDQGRGPDWRLAATGDAAFTDQLLYIGATDQDNADKLNLCRDFIAHLLTDECQSALHRIGAFSVTDADSGYAAGDNLRTLEQALRQKPLLAPAPFDASWRQDVAGIVREFWRQSREPAAIMAQMSARFQRKSEH